MYESLHGYLYRNVLSVSPFLSVVDVKVLVFCGWSFVSRFSVFFIFVHRNSHKVDEFCGGPLSYLSIFFIKVFSFLYFCP